MFAKYYSVGDSFVSEMKDIFEKDVLGDISIVCNDGKIKKNKLLTGLVFPHLKYCEVFDNNTDHVIIAPDNSVEDILTIMAKKMGIAKDYSCGIGQIANKRRRGRPHGSLGKNKKIKVDEENTTIVVAKDVEEKADDKQVSYEYNPSKMNILKARMEEINNQKEIEDKLFDESSKAIEEAVQSTNPRETMFETLVVENDEDEKIEKVFVTVEEDEEIYGELKFVHEEPVNIGVKRHTTNNQNLKIRISCQHCDKSYGTRSHLNRHIQSSHNGTSE